MIKQSIVKGMFFLMAASMCAQEKGTIDTVSNGMIWLSDSRAVHIGAQVVKLAATIGGLAFFLVIAKQIAQMGVMGMDYDENAELREQVSQLAKSVFYAHARINAFK